MHLLPRKDKPLRMELLIFIFVLGVGMLPNQCSCADLKCYKCNGTACVKPLESQTEDCPSGSNYCLEFMTEDKSMALRQCAGIYSETDQQQRLMKAFTECMAEKGVCPIVNPTKIQELATSPIDPSSPLGITKECVMKKLLPFGRQSDPIDPSLLDQQMICSSCNTNLCNSKLTGENTSCEGGGGGGNGTANIAQSKKAIEAVVTSLAILSVGVMVVTSGLT